METCLEVDANAVVLWLLSTVAIIFLCSEEASGAETCSFQQGPTTALVYCEDGCCDQNCCSPSAIHGVDTALIFIIVGVIVGVIIVVLIIIAVICCLKGRKTDKNLDKPAIKPVHSNAAEADDPERPKFHRENATFMVNGLSPAKVPHPRVAELRESLNKHVHTDHSGHHGVRRHSLNLRNSRVRHSDSVLPQVDERDELEAEESVL